MCVYYLTVGCVVNEGGRLSAGTRQCSPLLNVQTDCGHQPASCSVGTAFCEGGRAAGGEADYSYLVASVEAYLLSRCIPENHW